MRATTNPVAQMTTKSGGASRARGWAEGMAERSVRLRVKDRRLKFNPHSRSEVGPCEAWARASPEAKTCDFPRSFPYAKGIRGEGPSRLARLFPGNDPAQGRLKHWQRCIRRSDRGVPLSPVQPTLQPLSRSWNRIA